MKKTGDGLVLEPVDTVLSNGFLDSAARELGARGFVTDEHSFAPYRETIAHYVQDIEHALTERGQPVHLQPGFLPNHPDAGYAYFIYDTSRFASHDTAQGAVASWLHDVYKNNELT